MGASPDKLELVPSSERPPSPCTHPGAEQLRPRGEAAGAGANAEWLRSVVRFAGPFCVTWRSPASDERPLRYGGAPERLRGTQLAAQGHRALCGLGFLENWCVPSKGPSLMGLLAAEGRGKVPAWSQGLWLQDATPVTSLRLPCLLSELFCFFLVGPGPPRSSGS